MSHDIQGHPDITSGFIDKFSSYKVERNTKTVIKNILTQFFSKHSNLYKFVAPEIIEIENNTNSTNIFIEKEFPYYERRLPFIAILSRTKREKKAFLGGDDLLYSQTILNTSTGFIEIENHMYGNMYEVPITLSIAATSPETRMQISELISLCFTHYYRWVYMYKDIDGSQFNVIPNGGVIEISSEREVIDQTTVSIIYTCSVGMISSVEYIFVDVGDNYSQSLITGLELQQSTISTSTGNYTIGIDPVNLSLTW